MIRIFESLARFKALVENAQLTKAEHAADKLRKQLRVDTAPPLWLAGVSVALDSGRTRAAIQVSVKPGYHPSSLPSHIDGVPVIMTQTHLTGHLPF